MRSFALAVLPSVLTVPALAGAGGPAEAFPPGAHRLLGIVTFRLGQGVIVWVGEGARVKAGQELAAGRPTRLRIDGSGESRVRRWSGWEAAGTLALRRHLGGPFWLADVTRERAVKGPGGRPAPTLRPGDRVYRPSLLREGAREE